MGQLQELWSPSGNLFSRFGEKAADSTASTLPAASLVLFFSSGSLITNEPWNVFAQKYCWVVALLGGPV